MFNSNAGEHLSFTRVISVGDEPSLIEKTYLSKSLSNIFVDLDTNQLYYPLIKKYGGEELSHVKISFTAKNPDTGQQKFLNISPHQPFIVIRSQLFNTNYKIIEVVESVYRGDKYLFTLESLGFNLGID